MADETQIRVVEAGAFSTGEDPQETVEVLHERAAQARAEAAELPEGDAIRLLLDQHARIRDLLAAVATGAGEPRQQRFDELRELLARHETAEEMALRPVTRTLDGGGEIAEARMAEENHGKDVLTELERMGVTDPGFDALFAEFRVAIQEHANAEEHLEFPEVQGHRTPEQLAGIGTALRAAERTAPTHPHPSARSTGMNYVAGPFAAMVDRVRDAIANVGH